MLNRAAVEAIKLKINAVSQKRNEAVHELASLMKSGVGTLEQAALALEEINETANGYRDAVLELADYIMERSSGKDHQG